MVCSTSKNKKKIKGYEIPNGLLDHPPFSLLGEEEGQAPGFGTSVIVTCHGSRRCYTAKLTTSLVASGYHRREK
ncbi:hypothetical protein MUK42_20768 [Musa troglodytarum]|uniref:Uncharacterized protein n=1 Tax=Musa troglodytarum TaxID=320322 RepID=A0A9E7K456_9LILI|nr:hypothetical protein MUK42_20768 [Musa troglodytarum]